jgi:sialidase-1
VAGQKEATEIGEGSFAVSLWFTRKPEGVDNQMRRILSTGAWSNKEPGWTVYLSKKASSVAFVIGDGKQRQTFYARTGKGAIADGKWRHYAVVVDRSTAKVRSYLDGKKVSEEGIKQLKKVSIESHTGLQMGGSGDDRVRHRGMLDDVAIWKRALRTDEISRIHGGGGPLGEVLAADGR